MQPHSCVWDTRPRPTSRKRGWRRGSGYRSLPFTKSTDFSSASRAASAQSRNAARAGRDVATRSSVHKSPFRIPPAHTPPADLEFMSLAARLFFAATASLDADFVSNRLYGATRRNRTGGLLITKPFVSRPMPRPCPAAWNRRPCRPPKCDSQTPCPLGAAIRGRPFSRQANPSRLDQSPRNQHR